MAWKGDGERWGIAGWTVRFSLDCDNWGSMDLEEVACCDVSSTSEARSASSDRSKWEVEMNP